VAGTLPNRKRPATEAKRPVEPKKPRVNQINEYDEDIRATVSENWKFIVDWKKTGRPIKDSYNIRTDGMDLGSLETLLEDIFSKQQTVFKVSFS
jgi:hypothetical protein